MKRAVIDQAGLKIIFVGLLISVFFGLIFKSQIRSSVVSDRLQKTLDVLKRDLLIDFESAEVKLSDWGLPRPTVEINGLRLSPVMQNCQNNQIYIEKLSIPLSFNLIFSKNKKDQGISTLRASLIEVRIDRLNHCFSKNKSKDHQEAVSQLATQISSNTVVNHAENTAQISAPQKHQENSLQQFFKQSTALKEISIDRLRLIAPDIFKLPIDLNAVQLDVKSGENQITAIDLQAQMLSFKDSAKNFYLLKSEINFKAQALDNGQIDLKLNTNGLLIDRPFVFDVRYDQKNNSLEYIGEVKNVSAKAFLQMFQLLNDKQFAFKASAFGFAAISGYVSGEYFLNTNEKEKSNLVFKNLQMIARSGLINVNEINFYNLKEGQFKPFDLYFNNINMSDMFGLSGDHRLGLSFEEAGFLSGNLSVLNRNDLRLKALVEKSHLIFSNQGRRAVQVFDSYNLVGSYKDSVQSLQLNDFVRGENKIKGFIRYSQRINDLKEQSNESSRLKKELEVNLSGLIFGEDVLELYTGQRQESEINWKLQSDLVTALTSQVEFKSVKYKDIQLKSSVLNVSKDLLKNSDVVLIEAKGQYVEANKTFAFKLTGDYSAVDKSIEAQLVLLDDKMKKYNVTGIVNEPRLELKLDAKK